MQLLDPRCQSKTRSYSTKSSHQFLFFTFTFYFFKTHTFIFSRSGKSTSSSISLLLISKTSTQLSFFLINYHKKNTMRVCKINIMRGNYLDFRIWLLKYISSFAAVKIGKKRVCTIIWIGKKKVCTIIC